MKTLTEWFEDYGESHRNERNKAIHYACVPLIYFSVLGLLSGIPSYSLCRILPGPLEIHAHFGTLLLPFVLLYYLRFSIPITVGMAIFSVVCLGIIGWIDGLLGWRSWQWSLGIFAAAWVGQFFGHRIEGKKPSFLKDLSFLLIGPAWILAGVYRKWGISY